MFEGLFGKKAETPAEEPTVFDTTPTGQDMVGEGEMAAPMGESVSPEVSAEAVAEIEKAANGVGDIEETDEAPMLDEDDEDTPIAA